jgi:hypothetical protein
MTELLLGSICSPTTPDDALRPWPFEAVMEILLSQSASKSVTANIQILLPELSHRLAAHLSRTSYQRPPISYIISTDLSQASMPI